MKSVFGFDKNNSILGKQPRKGEAGEAEEAEEQNTQNSDLTEDSRIETKRPRISTENSLPAFITQGRLSEEIFYTKDDSTVKTDDSLSSLRSNRLFKEVLSSELGKENKIYEEFRFDLSNDDENKIYKIIEILKELRKEEIEVLKKGDLASRVKDYPFFNCFSKLPIDKKNIMANDEEFIKKLQHLEHEKLIQLYNIVVVLKETKTSLMSESTPSAIPEIKNLLAASTFLVLENLPQAPAYRVGEGILESQEVTRQRMFLNNDFKILISELFLKIAKDIFDMDEKTASDIFEKCAGEYGDDVFSKELEIISFPKLPSFAPGANVPPADANLPPAADANLPPAPGANLPPAGLLRRRGGKKSRKNKKGSKKIAKKSKKTTKKQKRSKRKH